MIVTILAIKLGPVDRAPVKPRWSSGFQPSPTQSKISKLLRKPNRGTIPHPAALMADVTDMDDAVKEGARGENSGSALNLASIGQDHATNSAFILKKVDNLPLKHVEIPRSFHKRLDRLTI